MQTGMAEPVCLLTGVICRGMGLLCRDIGLFWQRYRAMVWKYMALLQRDWAFLLTSSGSVSTQVCMAVISSQLSSFVLSLVRIWDCNTLQHVATHCNTLQHTACRHNSTLRSSCLSSFVISLVRICNTFSGASSFICVTWLIHSEETHSRTHTCDMTIRSHLFIRDVWQIKACTHSYLWHGTHLFMCVTWHVPSEEKHSHVWHEDKKCSLTLLFFSGA